MTGINNQHYFKMQSVFALYVNWTQWSKENDNRSPLFAAAEENLTLSDELHHILRFDGSATVDPVTGLEAFMLAAVGEDSKLESVYVLLENHPAAINPYV